MIRPRQLGQASAGRQFIGAGVNIGTQVATPIIAKSITAAAWGVPVVGAAIGAVTLAITALLNRKGPKQKVAATKIVDGDPSQGWPGIIPLMRQNVEAYQASARTQSDQAAALQNYDALYQEFLRLCGDPALGDPGKRCIEERVPGGKYDLAAQWLDPIRNDPDVKPDPTPLDQAAAFLPQLSESQAASLRKWLLPGIGLVLAVALFADDDGRRRYA